MKNRLMLMSVLMVNACAETRSPPVVYPDGCGSHVECFNKSLLNLSHAYKTLEKAQQQAVGLVPAGTVVAYAGSVEPPGWMFCDGRMLDKNDPKYKALFAAIGTTHGGDANPRFQIPDYRGVFLRGVDRGARRDPDASARSPSGEKGSGNSGDAVGTYQADMIRSHTHGVPGLRLEAKGGSGFEGAGLASNSNQGGSLTRDYESRGVGGSETRPRNVSVNYIIKL